MSDDGAATERFAEVLKLAFVDGLGVRAIARRLHMARKTVRRFLDREQRKHATIEMTMRYAHLSPGVRRDVVRMLDAFPCKKMAMKAEPVPKYVAKQSVS